jgi:asparagine synthase (glutamine-hydrolysing)
MCGIAGIWELDNTRIERGTIERFVGALAHRGPDGQRVALEHDDRVALGHRRLAILDLTEAATQPMTSASGRHVIAYNGEIYNFLELRHLLERQGFAFRSESDTEVILAAFEHWGPDCLLRFNGMWALAIWDRRERRMFLARDRFGVKPLYVLSTPRRLAFASELKAFLRLDRFEPAENTEALRARLAGNGSDHVLVRGIESLAPGHSLEASANGVRIQRWWNTLDHLVTVPKSLEEQAEQFGGLLFDACALRMRSDVSLGSALSGGLDSSSIVCSLSAAVGRKGAERLAPEWRAAYIAGFPGTLQDEEAHAVSAAAHAGVTPIVRRFTGDDVREHLDAFLHQYEEVGGIVGVTSWLLYRAMREDGVHVSLDGHGGDELLAGYGLHLLLGLVNGPSFTRRPLRALDLIRSLYGMQGPGSPERAGNSATLAALTYPALRAVARRVLGSQRRLEESRRRHAAEPYSADAEALERLGPLTSILYQSFHRESLPRILRNFDSYSMGHGVEVRMPFLDPKVVCYAFSAPDESKVSGGFSKRLLRESMRGVVPEPLRVRRDKLGFNAPVAEWLGRGLADWLWEEVNDSEFLRSDLWDGRALMSLARSKRASGVPWEPAEARRATLAVTAHRWRTRWLSSVAAA